MEYDSSIAAGLYLMMNLDVVTITRTGYTVLDLLSDVGGIESILISGLNFLLAIWNYNNFDSHLASKLYKPKDSKVFVPSKLVHVKEFFMDFLHRKLVCCR